MSEFQEGMIAGAVIYFVFQGIAALAIFMVWPKEKRKGGKKEGIG